MKLDNLVEKRILGEGDIIHLLRNEKVMFIVDNAGYKTCIPQSETLGFWKDEVKIRVVEPEKAEDGFELEEYPREYCHIASEYRNVKDIEDTTAYVVLRISYTNSPHILVM